MARPLTRRQVIRSYSRHLILTATTAVATSAAAPTVRRFMLRRGILDNPNQRSSHTQAVPRGGRLACVIGASLGCVFGRAVGFSTPWRTATGAAALAFVGFADDQWTLPTVPRLASQVGIGMMAGLSTQRLILGTVTVPTLVNMVNFMDGIDGITALSTAVWGANAATIGTKLSNAHLEFMGAITMGSALGFLPHNLGAERMFLGDVGSYLIGSLMALTALHPSLTMRTRVAVTAPLIPYFVDAGATLAVRAFQGKNIFAAHREHVYQRLANDRGLGHLPVSLLYAAASAATTCLLRFFLDAERRVTNE